MTPCAIRRFALSLVPLTLLAWACGGTTPVAPTAPVIFEPVTETFAGTLAQGGSDVYPFLTQAGTVTAKLASVDPLSTAALGVELGTWDGTTCTAVVTNASATSGTTVIGTATGAIRLCARVYDVGNIAEGATVSYTVTVDHQKLAGT